MKKKRIRSRSRRPEPVTVFAAGCFNRMHKAHVRMLRWARGLGDRLVVVLAHDAHNRKPNAVPGALRLSRLRRAAVADSARLGDKGGFAAVLRRVKPAVLALGYDQRLPDDETHAAVRELGIRVVSLPWGPGKEEHHACRCHPF
ncbi:MAG: adenylyltransferase/cytidyltransferase family protein [Elusimicrobia bacterium]|nr:adenylyltransferase/cytidyltransferase family protein [Elusimicrobiota bacterium]